MGAPFLSPLVLATKGGTLKVESQPFKFTLYQIFGQDIQRIVLFLIAAFNHRNVIYELISECLPFLPLVDDTSFSEKGGDR